MVFPRDSLLCAGDSPASLLPTAVRQQEQELGSESFSFGSHQGFCSISGAILSSKRILLAPNEARVARLGRYFLPDQPLHVSSAATTASRSSFAKAITYAYMDGLPKQRLPMTAPSMPMS